MSLKCSIGSYYLKCWGRMIHTLVQTGENEIIFQFTHDSLTLSTFDSSLTICCSCKFDRGFFQSYDVKQGNQLSCKIPSKCLLKPFKSLRFIIKCCDGCDFEFDPERNTILVTLPCKGGIKLRYKLNFSVLDESLQVDYNDDDLKSIISGDAKLMLRSLSNFTATKGVSDLTLKVTQHTLCFKNCVNDMIKKEGKVYTELTMNAIDFAEYKIESESELTFPMREFKSFVSSAEYLKASLSMRFLSADEPVCIKAMGECGLYVATLLMATTRAAAVERRPRRKRNTEMSASNSSSVYTDFDEIPYGDVRTPSTSSSASVLSASLPTSPKRNINSNNWNNNHGLLPIDLVDLEDDSDFPEDNIQNTNNNDPIPTTSRNNNNGSGTSSHILTGEDGRKRLKMIFPQLGRHFDPSVDLPGFNDVLVACSDEEDD